MIASALSVRRLLNRLPEPRRASLQDVAHAAAMTARATVSTAVPSRETVAALDELTAWQSRADQRWAA